jgi:hypothetical protein
MDGHSSRWRPVIDSLAVCTDIRIYDDAQIRADPLLQFDRQP